MSYALSSGVTGLQAHQKMLDVAGNNLANVNTIGFKGSNVTFSDTLSQTLRNASGPSGDLGGVNPQQMGSGVQIANIVKNMTQGSITATGQDLDMAISGAGFFCLSNGDVPVYSRAGAFAVDANNYLVDPATGFRVQRIGSTGEVEGFQTVGDDDINIPYNVAIPPEPTTEIAVSGNLRAEGSSTEDTASKLKMRMGDPFTIGGITPAETTTLIQDLDQFSGAWSGTETLNFTGAAADGTTYSWSMAVDATTTVGDVINAINSNASFSADMNAYLQNGEIFVEANNAGYNKCDFSMSFTAGGADLALDSYFRIDVPAGNDVALTTTTIFDSQGGEHTLSLAFVRTDTPQKWDMIIKSVSGDVNALTDRRINGIGFTTIGEFDGLDGSDTGGSTFQIDFKHDPGISQVINVNLGVKGQLTGITQFATAGVESTAVAEKKNGYEAGMLSSVTVDTSGMLVGHFTNGELKDIAALKMAVFQNPMGLESVGNNYFVETANSGVAMETTAMSNGAGKIQNRSLENSNVDTAIEFVRLMEAQNGFQANSRTIQIANEVLKELTNIIR